MAWASFTEPKPTAGQKSSLCPLARSVKHCASDRDGREAVILIRRGKDTLCVKDRSFQASRRRPYSRWNEHYKLARPEGLEPSTPRLEVTCPRKTWLNISLHRAAE